LSLALDNTGYIVSRVLILEQILNAEIATRAQSDIVLGMQVANIGNNLSNHIASTLNVTNDTALTGCEQ